MEEDNNMERGTKRPAPESKTPLMMLYEIRANTKFNLVSSSENPPTFVMACDIDGDTFTGRGRSKQIAKAHAAKAVLEKKFNLEFSQNENGDEVFNLSTKKQRNQYRMWKVEQREEKDVSLSSIYGDQMKFRILSDKIGACKVSLTIEGTIIEGWGNNLKDAKALAQDKGLTFLKEMGLYDQRVEECRNRIQAKLQKKKEYFLQKKEEQKAAKNGEEVKPIVTPKPVVQSAPQIKVAPTGQSPLNRRKPKDKGTKL